MLPSRDRLTIWWGDRYRTPASFVGELGLLGPLAGMGRAPKHAIGGMSGRIGR